MNIDKALISYYNWKTIFSVANTSRVFGAKMYCIT